MTNKPRNLNQFLILLLAFSSGASAVFSLSPFNWWPLSLLAPVVLFALMTKTISVKQSVFLGYVYGLGLFSFGAYWIYYSLFLFGDAIKAVALLTVMIFIVLLSGYIALFGYIAAKAKQHLKPSHFILLFLPALFVGIEYLRGWAFSGFPWFNLGAAHTHSPLGVLYPVMGEYGVSLLVAFIAALFVYIFQSKRYLFALLLLPVIGSLWLFNQTHWTEKAGPLVDVAIIQGNIHQADKYKEDLLIPTLMMYRTLTLENADADLVIWPETAIPVFMFQADDEYMFPLMEELEPYGTHLLAGVFKFDRDPVIRMANRMQAMPFEGGYYEKRHLVPFGEYMPMRNLLEVVEKIIDIPMADLSSGSDYQPPVELVGQKLGVSVCYEAAFGRLMMDSLPEATMLVNVSNDAWFGDSLAPHQNLQLTQIRAMEAQRPLIRATSTGMSAFIGADGWVNKRLPLVENEAKSTLSGKVIRHTVQPLIGQTFYVRFGDKIVFALIVLMFIAAFFGTFRKRIQS